MRRNPWPAGNGLVQVLAIAMLGSACLAQTTWTNFESRQAHAMIADPGGSGLIMFGGKDLSSGLPLGDTWQSNNTGLWQRLSPASRPCARSQHAMAGLQGTDSTVSVMFGGIEQFRLGDTWCWNGNSWSFAQTGTSPSARTGHAMATDVTANLIVLYGGFDGSNLDDTWTFDGTNWTQRFPATNPTGRFGHAMAWDAGNKLFVMFGGNGARTDTWQFDQATDAWTQRVTANTPPGRVDTAMAYHPFANNVVMFGGLDGSQNPLDDTWVWDRTNNDWVRMNPTTVPPARSGHSLAADPLTGNLVLFGGRGAGGKVLVGFWEWDGSRWTRLDPPPSPRRGSPLANMNGPKTVLFGGVDASTTTELGDTWELTGITWEQRFPAFAPSPRFHHGLAHDANRGRTVMFGGNLPGFVDTNETWEWDGSIWHAIAPPTPPPPTSGSPLVYDPVRDNTICLVDDETWLYDGRTSTWTQMNTLLGRHSYAAFDNGRGRMVVFTDNRRTYEWDGSRWNFQTLTGPGGRLAPAMVYDETRGVVTLFGGSFLRDTWEWNGTSWTQRSPAVSPPGLFDPGMVYDAARGETVLFGGAIPTSQSDETWVWNGTTWAQRFPATKPPARVASNLAYDPSRGVVVMFGGEANSSRLNDTWEWNGTDWSMKSPANMPAMRSGHGLAYDPVTQRVLLFGGKDGSTTFYNDTWAWDGANWTQLSPTTSPSIRAAVQRLVTDMAGGRVLLFGGQDPGSAPPTFEFPTDTWEWNGADWALLSAASRPGARHFHGMSWDPRRQVVVLFGGRDSTTTPSTFLDDTWEWDGVAWKNCLLGQSPAPRSGVTLAFDSLRDRMVLVGGQNASQEFSDTWERETGDWTQSFPVRSPGPLSRHGMAFDPVRGRTVALAATGLAWDYGLVESAASYEEFGFGCAGSGGVPMLSTPPGTGPWIGETLTIDLTNLPVPGSAFLLFGPRLAPPVSLGFVGIPANCLLQVNPVIALPASNSTPSFRVSFALPRLCEMIGQSISNQIFAFDPTGSGGTVSPGALMIFGAR